MGASEVARKYLGQKTSIEAVFKEAIPERELVFGTPIHTFRNLRDAAYPVSYVPRVDHIAIWKDRMGIVSEVKGVDFKCIEFPMVTEYDRNSKDVLGFIMIPQISIVTV